MMTEITSINIPKKTLQDLNQEVIRSFSNYKDVEIIRSTFFEDNKGLIYSKTDLYANNYVHTITLELSKSGVSWIYRPNCIENTGMERPV